MVLCMYICTFLRRFFRVVVAAYTSYVGILDEGVYYYCGYYLFVGGWISVLLFAGFRVGQRACACACLFGSSGDCYIL